VTSLRVQARPTMAIRPPRRRKAYRLLGRILISPAWFIASLIISHPAAALDMRAGAKPARADTMSETIEPATNNEGIHYRSGQRRDPFLHPLSFSQNSRRSDEQAADRDPAPPGMAGTRIEQATLQGISMQDNRRVAIVRGMDGLIYFLREGDTLFDGYLKAIGSDSITLVRKTKMKSGKTLAQDVIKRLVTP
jgi:hypothetical protein